MGTPKRIQTLRSSIVERRKPVLFFSLPTAILLVLAVILLILTLVLSLCRTVSGIYRVLLGKPERKRPLGRRRRGWEDNIRMDLQEVEWGHGLD